MRRSSVVVLIMAGLLLAAMAFLYVRSFDTIAPPMSVQVATDLLNRGKAALERRDVEGIMELTAPDARLLGRSPEQMRTILNQAMAELGREHLTITWSDVSARQTDNTAYVSFNLQVGQKTAGFDATYYNSRIRLELQKVRIPHWFGLYSTEEWRVSLADSDRSLDVPIP
jgi:hypothetical protein